MADVVFNKLTLCGFGLYREPVSFKFDPSLAVLTGPNESGKSTLVNGLLATLFGLFRREDETRSFTTARFRNWDSPPGFWGELELTASGQLYRLRREFETHQTRLLVAGDGGSEILFQGEHNRFGRGPEIRRYNEALRDVLGVADQNLFESVFCVSQEAEEESSPERGRAVQQLVAGSRERSFNDVLKRLFEAFREISRESGTYGIAPPDRQPRDGRKDQALERVTAEISELKTRLESSRSTLAGLAEMRGDLAAKETDLAKARESHKSSKRTLDVWTRWDSLKEERKTKEDEQDRLGRVIEAVSRLEREAREGRDAALRDYPEFKNAPPDIGEKLDTLASLAGDTRRAEEERRRVESDIRGSFGQEVFAERTPEELLQQLDRRAKIEKDLEDKARELQEIEVRASEARVRRNKRSAVLGFIGLLAGLVLGTALGLGPVEAIVLALGAGIVVGGVSLLVIRPKMEDPADAGRYRELSLQVGPAVANLAKLNQDLGSLSGVEAQDLGVLREKLRRLTAVSREAEDTGEEVSSLRRDLAPFLQAADGDPSRARKRHEEFEERMRSGRTAEANLTGILEPEQVKSVGDLQKKKARIDNTIQVLIAEERKLRTEHPFLERISEAADSVELDGEHRRLKQKVEESGRVIGDEDERIRKLERSIARLEGEDLVDVAAEEIRLRELEARRERLLLERDAVLLAYRVTQDAIDRYQEGHQEILGRGVNDKFSVLTGNPGRRIELMTDFSPRIIEESGQECAMEQLSRGARDQLDLAVRLAVAEMIAGDVRIPLIFDDPFLTYDPERLEILRRTLVEISKSRQVILLTHRGDLGTWGARVEMTRRLDPNE